MCYSRCADGGIEIPFTQPSSETLTLCYPCWEWQFPVLLLCLLTIFVGRFEVRGGGNCLGFLGFLCGDFPTNQLQVCLQDTVLLGGYQIDQSVRSALVCSWWEGREKLLICPFPLCAVCCPCAHEGINSKA